VIRVEFTSGDARGRVEAVEDLPFLVGRSSECQVRIDPDKDISVSGKHVEFKPGEAEGSIEIIDHSRNGTWMNGKKIEGKAVCTSKFVTVELGQGGPRLKVILDEITGVTLNRPKTKKQGKELIKTTAETKAYSPADLLGEQPKDASPKQLMIIVGVGAAVILLVVLYFALRSS
jgi:hypothetical protein